MPNDSPSVALLSTNDLKSRLDRGESLVLLDVREEGERAFAAIPVPPTASDLHIPMAQISDSLERLRAVAQDRSLVVYCHLGMRSMMVATWLAGRGLEDVQNLEGGIEAWSVEVDPSVSRY